MRPPRQVFAIHCEPNYSLPWQRKRQFSSSSSGFIIEGRRILTNAHCVADHTQVKVKRRGSDVKYVAQVLAVATEGDMALLTVEDEAFWRGSEPVQFGSLPQLQDAVAVVGYPIGGDTMSVTSGVVSRIEVTSYVHGSMELLGIQIDAAVSKVDSQRSAFCLLPQPFPAFISLTSLASPHRSTAATQAGRLSMKRSVLLLVRGNG